MSPQELIFRMLSRQANLEALPWLEKTADRWRYSPEAKSIYSDFSAAIRFSGKGPLSPLAEDLSRAAEVVPGWNPSDWTVDQAARIYLLLSLPANPASRKLADVLYETADLGEALALLKALPLLADPIARLGLAKLGARSNVKSQFEAVALRSPYPMLYFDEATWNQMVAKAIFVDSPLLEIQGLEARANRPLDGILTDLAHERRAAGRSINPFMDRCLVPISERNCDD